MNFKKFTFFLLIIICIVLLIQVVKLSVALNVLQKKHETAENKMQSGLESAISVDEDTETKQLETKQLETEEKTPLRDVSYKVFLENGK